MVTGWLGRLGGRSRDGGAGVLINTAREVVGRRRSLQGGLNEIRHPSVLDALSESDFAYLDVTIAERTNSDREFATVLARLTHLAARAKSFDRQTVDTALRLEPLLPADDPNREREKLLRDAYAAAQRSGYVRGGRLTLARLAQRFLDAGESERARALFKQELEIADEAQDTPTEVDVALQLGDLTRRDGDSSTAIECFRRAGRSAQRIDYYRGVAEALQRQIEMLPPGTPVATRAAMQKQALEAAQRTLDRVLESRIAAGLADSLSRGGKPEDSIEQLRSGLEIAREIGDLSLESRCLTALARAESRLGNRVEAAQFERDLVALEERLGNRPAAAEASVKLGSSLLSLGNPRDALEFFEKARGLALQIGDIPLEQRALGGLGVTQSAIGHPTEALEHLMRALDLARRTNDLPNEAQWLGAIAQSLWSFDQPDEAIHSATDSLEIARRLDDQELQASMFALLGRIYAASKQATRAREGYGRALQLYRRLDQPADIVNVLSALAGLSIESGLPEQADSFYSEAITIATESGDLSQAAKLNGKLGRLAQGRGDQMIALDHLRRAVELAERAHKPTLLSKALQHYAAALHAANDPTAADAYRLALVQTQELNDYSGEALMRLNLGTLLASTGDLEEGMDHLQAAAALAARFGDEGSAIRGHIATAIAATERQLNPIEAAPRNRKDTHRPRFNFRRTDDRRSRAANSRPGPETGDDQFDEHDHADVAASYADEVPIQLLVDGEDQVYREETLPPD